MSISAHYDMGATTDIGGFAFHHNRAVLSDVHDLCPDKSSLRRRNWQPRVCQEGHHTRTAATSQGRGDRIDATRSCVFQPLSDAERLDDSDLAG
jgi:hypothetical protein